MSTIIQKNKIFAGITILATVIMFLLAIIFNIKTFIAFLLLLLIYIFIFSLFFPKIGLYLLILSRPILDIFSSKHLLKTEFFSLNLSSILGIFVIIFFFYILLKNNEKRKSPLLYYWGLFLSVIFISIFYSGIKTVSLIEFIRLFSIFSIFMSAYILIDAKNLVQATKVIILSATIPGLVALYQFFTKTGMSIPMEGIYNRIYGTFAHPNLLAYYLIIPIILSLLLLLIGSRKKIPVIIFFLPLIFFVLILLLTYTRGAWLALLLAVFIIGAIKQRKILFVGIIVSLLIFFSVESINNRVNDLIHPKKFSSIDWRINLWQDALKYSQENLWFGHGAGTAQQIIMKKRGEQFGSSDPHNDYLKILFENGIIGLVAYLLLLFNLFLLLYKKYLHLPTENIKLYALAALSIFISFCIMSFADNILRNTALQWSFWFIIGSLLSFLKKRKN